MLKRLLVALLAALPCTAFGQAQPYSIDTVTAANLQRIINFSGGFSAPLLISSGDIKATGNVNVQGTVNSTVNTTPASITNSGVALTANPNVADEVYYDSSRTTDNRIVEAIWFQGAYQIRFKSDSQAAALAALQITGGQAGGVTGITSTSGSGSWAHTGAFSATGASTASTHISTVATGTAPLAVTSTTPVANLTISNHPTVVYCGTTTTCANTALTGSKTVIGSIPGASWASASVTVTLSGASAFSSPTYECYITSHNNTPGATDGVTFYLTKNSGTSFTLNAIPTTATTNTLTVGYSCTGN